MRFFWPLIGLWSTVRDLFTPRHSYRFTGGPPGGGLGFFGPCFFIILTPVIVSEVEEETPFSALVLSPHV